jgi:HEPN domain-containing protein
MDEFTPELVRDWLTRAEHDLRSARALAALAEPLLDTAIYHCQQAAKLNPGFSQFEKAASVLTPYVSAFRYPGGSDELMPTRGEFDEALQHAQAIYDFVKGQLPV